jgi:hypothetical protein
VLLVLGVIALTWSLNLVALRLIVRLRRSTVSLGCMPSLTVDVHYNRLEHDDLHDLHSHLEVAGDQVRRPLSSPILEC